MTEGSMQSILFPPEAEGMVSSLENLELEDIGSVRWHKQHEYLEKLNMQAIVSASNQGDEFVKEFLISHAKLGLLIGDLCLTEVWRERVFAEFVKMGLEPEASFPIYAVLYHEAVVANLLETVLYHADAVESASEFALDLADYCHRRLVYLASLDRKQLADQVAAKAQSKAEAADVDALTDLQRQSEELVFDVGIKAVSLCRYLTDHLSGLPLSVSTRLLSTHDLPLLLAALIDQPPWLLDSPDGMFRYQDNKWVRLGNPAMDRFQLSRLDGQLWLALYQLLLPADMQAKYEMTDHRKGILLRLRSHLTEVTLDQMPALIDMRRYLEHLAITETPAARPSLILEQVPEIRTGLLRRYKGQWRRLAEEFSTALSKAAKDGSLRRMASGWASAFSGDAAEALLSVAKEGVPRCVQCGAEAAKRCSRCRQEWYCRRECQVAHWSKHKPACNMMVEVLKDELEARGAQGSV